MPQITLLTGPERRRRWSWDERRRILNAAFMPGAVVADVSRQFEVSTSLIYKWRRQAMTETSMPFAPHRPAASRRATGTGPRPARPRSIRSPARSAPAAASVRAEGNGP
ncbi:transposase, partial [Acetobacteraceae bacterium]|nr:transposase [Acetobacteraceae bacterium]